MRKKNFHTSNVISHHQAITYIMYKYNLPRAKVLSIINSFFGKHGLKKAVRKYDTISINSFGKIYYHGNTLRKAKRLQAEIMEYNIRTKQKLYDRRKRKALKTKRS